MEVTYSTCFYVCLSDTCSEVLNQLTTILYRRGHSKCYDFGLELETVLAKAQVEVSTYLMPQIMTGESNIVFHCESDTLNRTTANAHGNNIVNIAGGIMLTNNATMHCSSNRHEQTSMVWPCHEERGRCSGLWCS